MWRFVPPTAAAVGKRLSRLRLPRVVDATRILPPGNKTLVPVDTFHPRHGARVGHVQKRQHRPTEARQRYTSRAPLPPPPCTRRRRRPPGLRLHHQSTLCLQPRMSTTKPRQSPPPTSLMKRSNKCGTIIWRTERLRVTNAAAKNAVWAMYNGAHNGKPVPSRTARDRQENIDADNYR